MSADHVWAEGLLVFYEVFLYLEGALDRYSHTLIGEVDVPGMRRKEAFEKVLNRNKLLPKFYVDIILGTFA